MEAGARKVEEDYQIKLKKAEFEANQERIKAEGMKRTLKQL